MAYACSVARLASFCKPALHVPAWAWLRVSYLKVYAILWGTRIEIMYTCTLVGSLPAVLSAGLLSGSHVVRHVRL